MKYKLTNYDEQSRHFWAEDVNGNRIFVNITDTGELEGANNAASKEDEIKYCHSLIGKIVFIKELEAYSYTAKGIEIMEGFKFKNGSLVGGL